MQLSLSHMGFVMGLAVVGLCFSPAGAQKEVLDRVVAVVEDDAIFQSDVDQMVKQMILQRGATNLPPSERSELEKQALKELLDSRLVIAKAAQLGVQVSFTEIEKLVDQAIGDNRTTLGGEAAFRRQLQAEGLTMDELRRLYREQIRNRILVERVLTSEIERSSIQVTDEELRDAFVERGSELPLRPAVIHLATIFFSLESAENAKAAAKSRIEEIQRRIVTGEDFAELAREYSEDPSAKAGGALGSLKLDDLSNKEFAEAAASLSVGEVSDPVLTPFGYHLIQVTGMDAETGEVELRHILIRIKPGDEDIQGVYDRAEEVHKLLLEGAPFDSTAMRYSDDTATASAGGDLGWLRFADLPDFFREVLAGMSAGDISLVLREPAGFRIVRLIEREDPRPYEFEELQDELRKLVEQERIAAKFAEYIDGLYEEFYVEVRI